jgi:hypothetical protein
MTCRHSTLPSSSAWHIVDLRVRPNNRTGSLHAEGATITAFGFDPTVVYEPSVPVDLRWLSLSVNGWLSEIELQDSTD